MREEEVADGDQRSVVVSRHDERRGVSYGRGGQLRCWEPSRGPYSPIARLGNDVATTLARITAGAWGRPSRPRRRASSSRYVESRASLLMSSCGREVNCARRARRAAHLYEVEVEIIWNERGEAEGEEGRVHGGDGAIEQLVVAGKVGLESFEPALVPGWLSNGIHSVTA